MARPRTFDEADILARARDLFWEQGYTATSIQDLERHLGLNRSSIYSSFGDKETLYRKTLKAYQEESQGLLQQTLEESRNLHATLLALFAKAAGAEIPEGCHSPRGCYIVNATAELAAIDDDMLEFTTANRERFVQIMRHALEQAQRRGELDPKASAEDQATYLFLLYNGLQLIIKTQVDQQHLLQAIRRGIDGLDWLAVASSVD